jgi:hypothetical protein
MSIVHAGTYYKQMRRKSIRYAGNAYRRDNMVLVAFEMISTELGKYLLGMNEYERELMVLEHKINKVLEV